MAAYQPQFFLVFVSILKGSRHSDNFSRFCSTLTVKPPFCAALFLLSTATFGDKIKNLGEAVDTFQFDVLKSSLSNVLIKVLQSTVQLVIFFVAHLGCPVSS